LVWRLFTDRALRRARHYRIPPRSKPEQQSTVNYLVTATIVKNEGRFLREFVLFHREVGVDHMLIYDDGSSDDTRTVLSPFVKTGFVTVIDWPRFIQNRNNQFLAYQHAVATQSGKAFWLAIIDADEFLFAPKAGDLKSELKKREKFSCIGVYSHTFGTGGLTELDPKNLMMSQLKMAAHGDYQKNCTHRSIVQPAAVTAIRSANSVTLKNTRYIGWDENGKPICQTGETGHTRDVFRINHYFSRARRDFERKVARNYFGQTSWSVKMQGKIDELKELDDIAVVDTEISAWNEIMQRALKK
jgi:hypothetical protein